MIHVSGLVKRYPNSERAALDGLSFDVPAGSIFGLLGPNGAGKTTLMSVLTGVLKADRGTVQIAGQTMPGGRRTIRALIGMAPQELAFYPGLSVAENLALFQQLTPGADDATRKRAIAVADLGSHLGKRAESLSGGLKRRLNFAIALLGQPRLLLLDEATAGVDPQSRNFLLDRIVELRRLGTTVLYSTHYLEEIERICDAALIVDHGRTLAQGPLAQLRGNHARMEEAFLELTRPMLRD